MSEALYRRAKEVRSRAQVRAWRYRQRSHADGTWYRLRRALSGARTAYVITADEAQALIEQGSRVEAVGAELVPPKTIVWLTTAQEVGSAREIPVKLSTELLSAEHLALVAFPAEA